GTGAATAGGRASGGASRRRTARPGGRRGSRSSPRTRRAGCTPSAGRTAPSARAARWSRQRSRLPRRGELAEQLFEVPCLLMELVQRPAVGLRQLENARSQVRVLVGSQPHGDALV